jgi:hypothetical protein
LVGSRQQVPEIEVHMVSNRNKHIHMHQPVAPGRMGQGESRFLSRFAQGGLPGRLTGL